MEFLFAGLLGYVVFLVICVGSGRSEARALAINATLAILGFVGGLVLAVVMFFMLFPGPFFIPSFGPEPSAERIRAAGLAYGSLLGALGAIVPAKWFRLAYAIGALLVAGPWDTGLWRHDDSSLPLLVGIVGWLAVAGAIKALQAAMAANKPVLLRTQLLALASVASVVVYALAVANISGPGLRLVTPTFTWPTPTVAPTGSSWFVPTGSMTVPRVSHTATLLSDGRVLIAGASGYGGDLVASAELYDPATGTFSPTGSMTTGRDDHTATLLSDGRVLLVGGEGYLASASAELYDPQAGTFIATGSPITARYSHTATLLADGRVLVAGGYGVPVGPWPSGGQPVLASAELYDPKTGTFSPTGSMAAGRFGHTATPLSDGRVLIAGGSNHDDPGVRRVASSAELYDPATGAFSQTGSTTTDRVDHTATLLTDGRVLIAGGSWRNGSAEVYDPKTGTFTRTGSMTTDREFHTATLLSDGRVLIAGGRAVAAGLASAELYDPKTDTFSPAGSMSTDRNLHTSTLLSDSRVLIAGGATGMGQLASAEMYRP